jgi:iron complex transport system substrate-binding protein
MSRNPRVVSLIASSTEIVSALGFADCLVARSHECDYPPEVDALPAVTRAKLRTDVSSLEIDRQVKDILRAGLSVYAVDADKLRELKPDVIVTQDHCEVCAVSTKDLEAAACDVLGPHVQVVSLHPNSLADIWSDIRRVADALGAPLRGARLVSSLQRRLHEVGDRCHELSDRPTVGFIEWIEPLMAGGNWVPELIALANAKDLLGIAGEHSDWIDFERLRAADPDVIVVAPCGFDLPRTSAEMPALVHNDGWEDLRAVHNNRVYITDGNAYFNRPGPRVVESFEMLAEIVHDGVFDFGQRGFGYAVYRAAGKLL